MNYVTTNRQSATCYLQPETKNRLQWAKNRSRTDKNPSYSHKDKKEISGPSWIILEGNTLTSRFLLHLSKRGNLSRKNAIAYLAMIALHSVYEASAFIRELHKHGVIRIESGVLVLNIFVCAPSADGESIAMSEAACEGCCGS